MPLAHAAPPPTPELPMPTPVIATPVPTPVLLPTPTPVPQTWTRPADGAVMVAVPGGDFPMGSPDGEGDDDEHPQHSTYVDAFWIDRTEVTNRQFEQFVQQTGYLSDVENAGQSWVCLEPDGTCEEVNGADWRHPEGPSSDISDRMDHPVVQVTWNDAAAYCQWAGVVLPTEAEWEKAARGTDGRIYPWGNGFDSSRLNYCDDNCPYDLKDAKADDGYAGTAPVGTYPTGVSPYGALDMAGNVWEWVADWYAEDYYGRSPDRNPQGPPSGDQRGLRGGSWAAPADEVRSARRFAGYPDAGHDSVGFRCAAVTYARVLPTPTPTRVVATATPTPLPPVPTPQPPVPGTAVALPQRPTGLPTPTAIVLEATPVIVSQPTPAAVPPTVTPAGTPAARIAFSRWDGTKHNMFIANTDGSGEQLVLERAAGPSWSPDRRYLAFYGQEGVDRQVRGGVEYQASGISNGIIHLDMRSVSRDITTLRLFQDVREGTARWAAWSPNGRMIAFDARRGGPDWHIYIFSLSDSREIASIPGEQADWSPNSRQLVYRSGRDNKQGIWISNRDDSNPYTITNEGNDSFPRWSFDGSEIVFHRDSGGNNVDIYVMNADGSHVRRLTNSPGIDTLPAWTPDGRIVFRSTRSGSWGIYIMNADGSDQQQIIANADPGPDWAFGRMDVW
jgi:formylglycine-generating enzyme required for sulfatase activity